MFSRNRRKARLLFALSDVLITILAFEAAYQTRVYLPLTKVFFLLPPVKALLLGTAALTAVFTGYWLEIYDRLDSGRLITILRHTFRQCALSFLALVMVDFFLNLNLSRLFLLLFSLYSWVLLCLFRWKAGRLVGIIRREFAGPHFVMVVGTGEQARKIGALLEESEHYGVRLVGFFSDQGAPRGHIHLRRSYEIYPLSDLPALLSRQVIDEIIFAVSSDRLRDLEETFLLCDEEGVRTRVAIDFFPHVNSDVYLDRLGHAPLLTFSAAPHDEVRLLIKRVMDVVLASAALILLLPFMILVALLIKLTSPGPALFKQIRCGLNGRRFVFYKFRSMCHNAEELKPLVAHLNTKQTAFKIPDDPRLTPIGRFLRRFSIDEWPQLWNVIRGDMSLVGPRPAVPEEVERYQRWQRRRLRMRPGMTCLWAICGRDNLDFDTWMKLDMEYIDNWSLALDWRILLKTIPHVLSGKGAH